MKKTISMLLVLILTVSLMAGCGKEDFWVSLDPLNADLDWTPNVIVEPEEPPYNLGGWTFDDSVSWGLELPSDGIYSLRFHYAMPGEYEPCIGYVSCINEDGEEAAELVEFAPTSAPGSWDTYDWVEITLELTKGPAVLTLMPWEMPEDQDYFLNLRLIQVYSGEYPGDPYFYYSDSEDDPVVEPDDDPAVLSEDGSGWWVRPEDYESEGLSLVNIFYADMDQGIWTAYNTYGEPGDSYDCYMEDGMFCMDFDMLGVSEFDFEGDRLCDPEDGTVEFQLVADPGFQGQNLSFDGTWYHCGNVDASEQMVIEGNHFQKVRIYDDGPLVENEGEFTKNEVRQSAGSHDFGSMLKLELEDFHYATPSADGQLLFDEESFDVTLYVHESALDPDMVPSWTMVNDLMNMDLRAYPDEESMMLLCLEPYGFYVVPYEADGMGYSPSEEQGAAGRWSIPEPGILRLEYEDGTLEDVELPEPEGLLRLENLGLEFQLEPIF